MTRHEKKILADLLELAANTFHNHGCNDHRLANTPENQALYVKVATWTGELAELGTDFKINMNIEWIWFHDAELMDYFVYILRQEQKKKICNFVL